MNKTEKWFAELRPLQQQLKSKEKVRFVIPSTAKAKLNRGQKILFDIFALVYCMHAFVSRKYHFIECAHRVRILLCDLQITFVANFDFIF